jgi:hypothetical protein
MKTKHSVLDRCYDSEIEVVVASYKKLLPCVDRSETIQISLCIDLLFKLCVKRIALSGEISAKGLLDFLAEDCAKWHIFNSSTKASPSYNRLAGEENFIAKALLQYKRNQSLRALVSSEHLGEPCASSTSKQQRQLYDNDPIQETCFLPNCFKDIKPLWTGIFNLTVPNTLKRGSSAKRSCSSSKSSKPDSEHPISSGTSIGDYIAGPGGDDRRTIKHYFSKFSPGEDGTSISLIDCNGKLMTICWKQLAIQKLLTREKQDLIFTDQLCIKLHKTIKAMTKDRLPKNETASKKRNRSEETINLPSHCLPSIPSQHNISFTNTQHEKSRIKCQRLK